MKASRLVAVVLIAASALAADSLPATPASDTPRVVRYELKESELKYVYGVATPVARVRPGDILETSTVDAFGNVLQKPGDTFSLVKGDNPLTGPFYVEGAEAGDTLVVKILSL